VSARDVSVNTLQRSPTHSLKIFVGERDPQFFETQYIAVVPETEVAQFQYVNGRITISFYRASYASAVLAVVVCPSVRLSVCLSQAGIVSKRQHIESRKERRTVAQGI